MCLPPKKMSSVIGHIKKATTRMVEGINSGVSPKPKIIIRMP
jgi:hypothetical protein